MFSILNRKEAVGERCPRCSKVNVDFVDLGLGMLGCLDCRSVFLTKATVVDAKKNKKPVSREPSESGKNAKMIAEYVEKMTKKVEPVKSVESFVCSICNKVCKNAIGLSSHMRSHPDAA